MNDEMNSMIDAAEAAGLWMFCQYHALWFAPQELRMAQAAGRFRWGVVNWQMRDPKERLEQLEREAEHAIKERDTFAAKLSSNTKLNGASQESEHHE